MSTFYEKIQGRVSKLLRRFGESAVFSRSVEQEYNPGTGEFAGAETITWTACVVKTGLSSHFLSLGVLHDGTRLEVGDMQILVDCKGSEFSPRVGDSVTFSDGTIWSIMQDMPVSPAGTLVLYKGIIRRG